MSQQFVDMLLPAIVVVRKARPSRHLKCKIDVSRLDVLTDEVRQNLVTSAQAVVISYGKVLSETHRMRSAASFTRWSIEDSGAGPPQNLLDDHPRNQGADTRDDRTLEARAPLAECVDSLMLRVTELDHRRHASFTGEKGIWGCRSRICVRQH